MAGYIWGLDFVRCFAALIVAVFHLSWRYSGADVTLDAGWVGVEIFFVISGFVIIGSAQGASPVEFVERRFARLYPAAIACALIDFAALRAGGDAMHDYHLLVGADVLNFVRSIVLLFGPFQVSALWTIPVELAFYAVVTLVLVFRWLNRIDKVALLLACWSALYLIPFALHMYGLSALPVVPFRNAFNMTLLRHGCFFGLGIAIWLLLNEPPKISRVVICLLSMALCCIEILARVKELEGGYAHSIDVVALAAKALSLFIASVAAIWLLSRYKVGSASSPRFRHVTRTLGLMTYPIYLTHEAVGGAVAGSLSRLGLAHAWALTCGLAACIAASYLVVVAIEPWLRRALVDMIHPQLVRLTHVPHFSRVIGSFSTKGKGGHKTTSAEPAQSASAG